MNNAHYWRSHSSLFIDDEDWVSIEDAQPEIGTWIVAELNGLRCMSNCLMKVREGDGLEHVNGWCYARKDYRGLE